MKIGDWLEERVGWRGFAHRVLDEPVPAGASFAYVFGSVLLFVLILQMVTGVLLAFYYSPSSTDAWASVAFIEDQVALGWLVRGMHHHGASAMVIVAGLHLFQVAVWGAYKRPRELNWITGVLLLGLVLAFALTGYLLPWDQTGYWATKVATGIAGSTPWVGDPLQEALQGGNEYGNLTITRFYAFHVLVLPALTVGLVVVHLKLFRRHGVTPHWRVRDAAAADRSQPFWPDQLFRDVTAMAAAFAALIGWTIATHGAPLGGPADPSSNFDARPEWYFRALFQLLKYFDGPLETVVALGTPVVVGVALLALPFIDRAPGRRPAERLVPLGVLAGLGAATAALTILSLVSDARDVELSERIAAAEKRAHQARKLAIEHGVPAAGGTAVYQTAPFWRARVLWADRCAHCHDGDKRKGPAIGPGYGSRAWIRGFLVDPSGDLYFGRTKLGKSEMAMRPVEQRGRDLDALVEMVYAESGAEDVDAALVERGLQLFGEVCSDCHERDKGVESEPGPNLAGRGSAPHLVSFIANPAAPVHFGDRNAMPKFQEELSDEDLRYLASWLTWLRTASPDELDALGKP